MNILHIHQDYPDGRPYPNTKAVSNLIEACKRAEPNDIHTVLSINRTSNPFKVSANEFSEGLSIVYWAIPLPFIYYWSMKISAYWIATKIKDLQLDLIHGHKLTAEGVFAYWLSKKINIPYVISVRGGSDINNIKRLSQHTSFFREVYRKASQVFWVSAWAKKPLGRLLSLDEGKLRSTPSLPNICNIDLAHQHTSAENRKKYVTATSFHQYKRKGIVELFQSIATLQEQGKFIEVDIYGTGDDKYKLEIEQLITSYQIESLVNLKGQVTQDTLLAAMSKSKGFLMPAVNETFGMAYIEALSVGCPILYVGGTGIDGYFEAESIGARIIEDIQTELTEAIEVIDINNVDICYSLETLQKQKWLSKFTSTYISNHYLKLIKQVLYD